MVSSLRTIFGWQAIAVGVTLLAVCQVRAQRALGTGSAFVVDSGSDADSGASTHREGVARTVRQEPTMAEREHIRYVLGGDPRSPVRPLTTLLGRSKSSPQSALLMVDVELPESVRGQAALDRYGFSPGVIDGMVGPKTKRALMLFQAWARLPVTGEFDEASRIALQIDAQLPAACWVLSEGDFANVGPCPTDWVAKSKLRRLKYESAVTMVAERGHCTRRLLAKLNPVVDLEVLKAGDALILPNVAEARIVPVSAAIEIDFAAKVLRVYGENGDVDALFHCSIAKEKRLRPSGPCRVKSVTFDPAYTFRPESWPEVKGVDRPLTIPPGPRNPVGVCWIGLSIKGYGIHGTPKPELIGKTGSHGCFRLTNWDALRLARMVRVGTAVRFIDSDSSHAAEGG